MIDRRRHDELAQLPVAICIDVKSRASSMNIIAICLLMSLHLVPTIYKQTHCAHQSASHNTIDLPIIASHPIHSFHLSLRICNFSPHTAGSSLLPQQLHVTSSRRQSSAASASVVAPRRRNYNDILRPAPSGTNIDLRQLDGSVCLP